MGVAKKQVAIISAIGIVLYIIWIAMPIVLVVIQSIRPQIYMFTSPPTFIFVPTAANFINVIDQNIMHFMRNSLIVAAFTTAVCLILGSMCAYALSSLKLPGRHIWALLILITRMVPAGTLMIPIYVIIRTFGLLNTHTAIILTHATLNLPFTIWMMRSFFDDVPQELEQAAMIDGCSRLKSFILIALPLSASGLVATGILTTIFSWNEFMFAMIISNPATRTLPVYISGFMGVTGIDWGGSSAAAVAACIPIFAAGIFVQKYLVRGLTMGAIKG